MPAFSFERLSPPRQRGPVPVAEKKQRGVIVQLLDRLTEARLKRSARVLSAGDKGTPSRE